jgi:hypothetical protein
VVSIPMAVLMAVQSYSSPVSCINVGAWRRRERVRTPRSNGSSRAPLGTFSAIAGIECFVPRVLAYLLYAFANPGIYRRLLVWRRRSSLPCDWCALPSYLLWPSSCFAS